VDFVEVAWSVRDLETGQERVWRCLQAVVPLADIGSALDTSTNSVVILVHDNASTKARQAVQDAIRAAGVTVRVERGSSQAMPA
jgi:hypothetical protein